MSEEESKSADAVDAAASVDDAQIAASADAAETMDIAQLSLEVLQSLVAEFGGQSRAGQEQMVQYVAHALETSGHVLVQAGTGTGKSLAYLVPVLLWCAREQRRAIISTATLALQRQIIEHDAPLVAAAVGKIIHRTPKVVLLKGWNNYACLRKAAGGYPEDGALISRIEAEYGDLESTSTGKDVVRAREWALESDTGDRDDLVPGVSDRVWAHVSLPKRECIGESCPLRESCFPALARYGAEEADVVVTNHSLIGVQSSGTAVLPPTDAYVIDEAHVLVERVTAQLTASLSHFDIAGVARLLRRCGLDDLMLDASAEEIEAVLKSLPPERITMVPDDLADALTRLLGRIQEAMESADALKVRGEEQVTLRHILRTRLADIAHMVEQVIAEPSAGSDLVLWHSVYGETDYLNAAPLDVSRAIAHHIFADAPAVLTSATLKIGGSFEPIAARVGFSYLDRTSWDAVDVGTPFQHEKQGILYVAAHLPEPNKDGYGNEQLNEILELVKASDGGALGLFTSRAAAERATEFMREHSGLPVLCQGEDQLPTLIREFADDDRASLFGTMALWQGVDVPGRTLRLVVIDRIPFPRPNEPLTQARSEAVQARHGNAFMEVSATQAALLLAQGAGRLLRSVHDRGVVAVLDPRLRTKRYASYLLATMPQMWRTTDAHLVRAALARLAAADE
ncbi:MAG: ATP-dependent DNA helicase [Actinomycetaceae bacterium]|nr:ATP-dependent DNA helicase [Arcanobacterium sp.]MDD7687343.1 ATP-dependent DNA helicase [Actinomycetaceae bacterium]MDY5274112.1 ATP-dependent DNA helicase [Arcanobacterium sp.]